MDRVSLKASMVIGVIGMGLISLIYFKPVSIERDYSAYIYAENSEFQKATEIKLVGELKKKLSLNHVFIGSIEVDGIKEQITLKRTWKNNNIFKSTGYATFIETKDESEDQYEIVGSIDASKDFNKILVKLSEVDNKYSGEFNICGPSSTREEGEAIFESFVNNLDY